MIYLTVYLAGIVAMFGLFAWRSNSDDLRTMFFLCLIWPFSIFLAITIFALDAVGIRVHTAKGTKRFGFRLPENPKAKGFAITVFGTEIQLFKVA
jgi:predicted membrane channel-forming protein YqfA (hemolysin III family)